MDRLGAFARGAGQGASLGWNDEIAAKLLAAMPGPKDPEGTSRDYAAGSPEADYRGTFRAENADAAEKYPLNYGVGAAVGGAPLAAAIPAAGGIAGAGLVGGALGGVGGAGLAQEGGRVQGAARGAGVGALGGLAAGAAPAVVKATQIPLPHTEPAYWHHNTPTRNVPSIAEGGLKVAEGGKNFPFKKNAGRSYWTDAENASEWKPKIADATGEEIAELRTTKPTEAVPGADASVRIRTKDTPADRIELKGPDGWQPLAEAPKTVHDVPTPAADSGPNQYMSENQLALPLSNPPPPPPPPPTRAALRPTRAASHDIEMPTIPRAGRVPTVPSDEEMAPIVARLEEKAALEAERSRIRDASRSRPPSPEVERLKYETRKLGSANTTVAPPRKRAAS